ncbi:DoxX family membrane protein [Flavobacterium polysaccharolyticum]|uniref:DoxX family membrane protein n=1 Tax=Flavobacterium polysaccharolyticum TaxID=3133148 RepID=A0ABU9NSG9_9FLAO
METQLKTFYSQFSRKIDVYSATLLRVSLAIVYIWFGALKVFETSPAEELVQETVYWLEPSIFIPLLGVAEMMIGFGLLIKKWTPIVILLLLLHMFVTFFPIVIVPRLCFNTTLFYPTLIGQYIVKNLVLIAAALTIIGKHHQKQSMT